MNTLFISDLHLHPSCPHITRAFFEFLQNRTINTQALYILGDFFDAWIGDDDDAPLAQEVASQLYALSQKKVAIYLMHGNRDFLLGNDYAARAGAQLIEEGVVIDLYGCPTLLLHGDSLCTQDQDYMAFRQQVRSSQWQTQILAQPLAARRALAAQLREQSRAVNSMKAEDIMDVSQEEVVKVMQEAKVLRLIHGHTHRPARHSLRIGDKTAERIVLGDWHDYAWCLTVSPDDVSLDKWPINKI